MSAQDTGGWAFPFHGSMGEVAWEGMTLRDYFAAKAMQALVSESSGEFDRLEEVPEYAYQIADAMLTARQK